MTPAPAASAAEPALPDERACRSALAVVVALTIGLRLFLMAAAPNTAEDFYITLRYAENIARGHGFVYNPGEHVLGTTTPLYTLLLTCADFLHLNATLCGKLLNIAADGLSCILLYRLGRAVSQPMAGLFAALCLALAPTNLTWAASGMESSLVAASGLATWTAWTERREVAAWAAAALLVLLRIDGLALAVLLLLATLARERRLPWRGLAVFTLLLAPWLLFAQIAFGSPVPTSLRAKLVVYAWHAPAGFPNALPFLRLMVRNPLGAFLVVGALLYVSCAISEISRSAERRQAFGRSAGLLLAPACWIGLHYGSMAFSKVFLFGWYFVPPTPIYYLLAMVGWTRAIRQRTEADSRKARLPAVNNRLWLYMALLSGVLSVVVVPRVARSLREAQAVEENLRIPLGLWLRDHALPTETVMLEPIGYIGYYSRLRVLDTVGLVSPEVLPFYRAEIASPYHALWTRFLPDWILLRAGEWSALQQAEAILPPEQRLESRYVLAQTWKDAPDAPANHIAFWLFHQR